MAQKLLVVQDLLFIETSSSDSVGLLWTSDQPEAETSTWQHNSHQKQTFVRGAGFEITITAQLCLGCVVIGVNKAAYIPD
jgi:hypothetical protein